VLGSVKAKEDEVELYPWPWQSCRSTAGEIRWSSTQFARESLLRGAGVETPPTFFYDTSTKGKTMSQDCLPRIDGMIVASSLIPAKEGTRAGHIVLVDLHPADPTQARFVTGWVGVGDTNWAGGNYFDSRIEANKDFQARFERGF
tara:strand:- start:1746 stop:2180 length:435 start_codon:yes stop_codon:yes gene_type:complete